jgi:hypothetical protein
MQAGPNSSDFDRKLPTPFNDRRWLDEFRASASLCTAFTYNAAASKEMLKYATSRR